MKTLKKCLPDILAVILFIVLAVAYFAPADFEGRILFQHDSAAGIGASREAQQYNEQTGKTTRWTNSLFGGMPTYQTAPSYTSNTIINQAISLYHLWLPDYVWYLFAYLLGFYILLRAFNFKQYLAALGSIIWAFSSYFLIIIAAGHFWKVMALAYLPPMIGGMVLAYRGKYLWGFTVTAIFTAFEIKANHVQMTYYYLFIILFMVIAWLVAAIRQHWLPRFWKASGVVAAAALIGVCINLPNLYHTWQYQKESMRGKSELVKKNSEQQTSSGLDRDYITQWSYGIDETMTLLVPDAKGGASAPLSQNSTAMKHADSNVEQMLPTIYDSMPQYFGTQPGTSGPVYVGAFVLFLFILGLFIVKGPMKWALLAATIFSILLSWGKNFMPLTDFFIDYVPMYAKFRTVASILVVAEFTIPLLAILALKRIVDEPDLLRQKMRWVYVSLGLTAGVALLLALIPSMMGPFTSDQEAQMFANIQGMTPDVQGMILGSLESMREAMVSADAWRSVVIILVGFACLLLFKMKKIDARILVGLLAVLCLVDLWQVDKRYLNDGMFVPRSERDAPMEPTQADNLILQDKDLDYRVLNFASDTFNENNTSYFHKSIGGYHAAKLRRYQELIEAYIRPEMQAGMQAVAAANGDMTKVDGRKAFPVLNMLNARYFILPLQGGQTMPLRNTYAQGNAWFVDKIRYVDNANEELDGIRAIDVTHEAVADKQFEQALGQAQPLDTTATIKLTAYEANNLQYEVSSKTGGLIVFSEIYYPGWTATVDGQEVAVGRVNYVLRAINVKPGHHKVVLDFHPKSIQTTETIAYTAFAIMVLLIVLAIVVFVRKRRQGATAQSKD